MGRITRNSACMPLVNSALLWLPISFDFSLNWHCIKNNNDLVKTCTSTKHVEKHDVHILLDPFPFHPSMRASLWDSNYFISMLLTPTIWSPLIEQLLHLRKASRGVSQRWHSNCRCLHLRHVFIHMHLPDELQANTSGGTVVHLGNVCMTGSVLKEKHDNSLQGFLADARLLAFKGDEGGVPTFTNSAIFFPDFSGSFRCLPMRRYLSIYSTYFVMLKLGFKS